MQLAALFLPLLALLRPPAERLIPSSFSLSPSTDAYLSNAHSVGLVSLSVAFGGLAPYRLATTPVLSPSPAIGFFEKFGLENGPVCPLYMSKLMRAPVTAVPSIPPRPAPTCVNRHLQPTFEVPGGKCANRHVHPTFEAPGPVTPYISPGLKLPEVRTACRLEDTPGPKCPVYVPRLLRQPMSPVPSIPTRPVKSCVNRHLHPNFEVPGSVSPYSGPGLVLPEVASHCEFDELLDVGGVPGVCPVPMDLSRWIVNWDLVMFLSAVLVGYAGYTVSISSLPRFVCFPDPALQILCWCLRACHESVNSVDSVQIDDEGKVNKDGHREHEALIATSSEPISFPKSVLNVKAPVFTPTSLLFALEEDEMDELTGKPGVEASIWAPSVTSRGDVRPVTAVRTSVFDATAPDFIPSGMSFTDVGIKAPIFIPTRPAFVHAGDAEEDTRNTSIWAPCHKTPAKIVEPVLLPNATPETKPSTPSPTCPSLLPTDDNDYVEDDSGKPGVQASIWATTPAAATSVPRRVPPREPRAMRSLSKLSGCVPTPHHTPSSTDDSLNSSTWAPRRTSTPVLPRGPAKHFAPVHKLRPGLNPSRWAPYPTVLPAARRPLVEMQVNTPRTSVRSPVKASAITPSKTKTTHTAAPRPSPLGSSPITPPAPAPVTLKQTAPPSAVPSTPSSDDDDISPPATAANSLGASRWAPSPAQSPAPPASKRLLTTGPKKRSTLTPILTPSPVDTDSAPHSLSTSCWAPSPAPTASLNLLTTGPATRHIPKPANAVSPSHSLRASCWAPSPTQSPAPPMSGNVLPAGPATRPTPTPVSTPSPVDAESHSHSLSTSRWAPSSSVVYASSTIRPPTPDEDEGGSESLMASRWAPSSAPSPSKSISSPIWKQLPHKAIPIIEPPAKKKRVRTRRGSGRCGAGAEEGGLVVAELVAVVV
ncbi:hypothetical protein Hypma_012015 [Hypsizygus marmoreus]|uniref:Uncharacterized protein n=1 Tax=Hypsizygus marmoreus TaxID=39966 RepID=A0A369JHP4_HYPMA|nr:hypothetical protein Hypma_012015 [Hypsizygus marmoreus]